MVVERPLSVMGYPLFVNELLPKWRWGTIAQIQKLI